MKSLEEKVSAILLAREKRVEEIERLCRRYGMTVVCIRCNYPGAYKENPTSQRVVEKLMAGAKGLLKIKESLRIVGAEGLTYILAVEGDYLQVKRIMVELEEEHPLGRLGDIDVYTPEGRGVGRGEIGAPKRRCYICNEEAHLCVRSRRHPLEEVVDFIEKRVRDEEASC